MNAGGPVMNTLATGDPSGELIRTQAPGISGTSGMYNATLAKVNTTRIGSNQ